MSSNCKKSSSRYTSLTAKLTFSVTAVALSIFYYKISCGGGSFDDVDDVIIAINSYHRTEIPTSPPVGRNGDKEENAEKLRLLLIQKSKSPPFPPPLKLGSDPDDGVSPPSSAPPSFKLEDLYFESEEEEKNRITTTNTNINVASEKNEDNSLEFKIIDPDDRSEIKKSINSEKTAAAHLSVKNNWVVEGPPPFNANFDAATAPLIRQDVQMPMTFQQEVDLMARKNGATKLESKDFGPTKVLAPHRYKSNEYDWAERSRFDDWLEYYKKIFLADSDWFYVCFWTLMCSLAVMSTGILPALIFISNNRPESEIIEGAEVSKGANSSLSELNLNRLLCFAVGNLLGDVFFHLLPESWSSNPSKVDVGLYVIAGLLTCLIIEKFCARSEESQHYVAALANLTANIMDNFTHGLAVGGSFLVSKRLGFVTTFAILLHEIPHEISDFAILLRANFDRWSALKAQLITATGGILGAFVALASANEIGNSSSSGDFSSASVIQQRAAWILPFTAGGFLNIALVQILPDILKEKQPGESLKQVFMICVGIAVMALLNSSMIL